MLKTISGTVSAQATPGEQVLIRTYLNNNQVALSNVITDDQGNFSAQQNLAVGTGYSTTIDVGADSEYKAINKVVPFEVQLKDRTITVTIS